jgi:hypothetical protein
MQPRLVDELFLRPVIAVSRLVIMSIGMNDCCPG